MATQVVKRLAANLFEAQLVLEVEIDSRVLEALATGEVKKMPALVPTRPISGNLCQCIQARTVCAAHGEKLAELAKRSNNVTAVVHSGCLTPW